MAVNDIPSNIGYGTITGRFLIAYADGADADVYPDGVPASGNIYFTPLVEALRDATSTPSPVTIVPQVITCSLDSNGYLCAPSGVPGVRLVATDNATDGVGDWYWKVEYRLTNESGSPLRGIPSHTMSLPSGSSVDLTNVIPIAG